MREVNQFVRKNPGMKNMPRSNLKWAPPQAADLLPNLPATSSGRFCPFCQGTDPERKSSSSQALLIAYLEKVTSSRRYVPQSPKDNQDVNRGRSASLLALFWRQRKIWEISIVPEAPSRLPR